MTLLALVPLFSVVLMLLWHGGQNLNLDVLTQLPPAPMEEGGGFGNAILGTLIMVALAGLISIPLGILTAVYLAQAKPENRFATAVRFAAKVLTGFPSILARCFCLWGPGPVDGRLLRDCGRCRPFDTHAADGHAYIGRRDSHGAGENEGGSHRHGRHDRAGCTGWSFCPRLSLGYSPA